MAEAAFTVEGAFTAAASMVAVHFVAEMHFTVAEAMVDSTVAAVTVGADKTNFKSNIVLIKAGSSFCCRSFPFLHRSRPQLATLQLLEINVASLLAIFSKIKVFPRWPKEQSRALIGCRANPKLAAPQSRLQCLNVFWIPIAGMT